MKEVSLQNDLQKYRCNTEDYEQELLNFIKSMNMIFQSVIITKSTITDKIEYLKILLSHVYLSFPFQLFFIIELAKNSKNNIEINVFSSKCLNLSVENKIKNQIKIFLNNYNIYNIHNSQNKEQNEIIYLYNLDSIINFYYKKYCHDSITVNNFLTSNYFVVNNTNIDFDNLNKYKIYFKRTIFNSIIGMIVDNNIYQNKYFEFLSEFILNFIINNYITINDLSTYIKTIEKQVVIDSLTGLYNRKLLDEFLDKYIELYKRVKKPFSLVYLDLDDFKSINDTYGHIIGDEYLKYIAKTIKNNIRIIDIPVRVGGDEFAIIFPNTSLDDTIVIVERLYSYFNEKPFKIKDIKIPVKVSIGIAEYHDVKYSKSDFLSLVDKNLYKAKKEGKNIYKYN
ncbi:hypothetical protein DEFDS_P189 (plasmid) [Deferribacter desulfuricans SSM1]|uniref:diguanylate cyclase n=1 Tax=Deferribacter desulfuricans (strain DSM 14783 / JCM 11476 / NBRC 101012 / SSM1) TaxID=639282 RepID=D3PF17_DEFDS|nr:GGDEF domain-containing protein [Deferribacter desulfuricans]BAI81809.1 hypothetical protein DEFDS_P189 [Deferribacter desulfuricans SSM1]